MTDATISPAPGPVEPTPMSFDQGVNAIESLLSDDREDDLKGADGAKPVEPSAEGQPADEDDDLVLDDADEEGNADVEPQAPLTVGDDYEVTLDGGEKITLGQLKRNNLYQQDYSKKTEALARERDQSHAEIRQLRETADKEISQQRERLRTIAARYFPQAPTREMLEQDPIGYMHAVQDYQERVAEMQALDQEDAARTAEVMKKQEEQATAFRTEEWGKFLANNKPLQTKEGLQAFREDVRKYGIESYKLTPEEVQGVVDSRFMQILADAIRYQKAKAKAKTVKEELAPKPKLVQQQRMNHQTVQSRDRMGRFETARQNGSIDAVARSIEDLL